MSGSELRIEVLNNFSSLTKATKELCDAVKSEYQMLAWVQDTQNSNISPREKATAVLSQLHYLDNQAPREILICAGFIGATEDTLLLAKELNYRKDQFKKSILALKSAKRPTNDAKSRSIQASQYLNEMGLGRLHLKQCYRKIPILDKIPSKISWTWAHTKAIKKISVRKAHEMLLKKGNDVGIQIQLQQLNMLPEHESLAIVQELAPHLRANLVFIQEKSVQRTMIKGPLPIFFPCTSLTPYPQFTPPGEKCGRSDRLIRSDVRLDPIPFLPAIRVHRYKKLECR